MGLKETIWKKIKDEIVNDPMEVGYAGKTDAEIAYLLNNSVQRYRTVLDDYPCPINRILSGIEGTPNMIDENDVKQAKLVI